MQKWGNLTLKRGTFKGKNGFYDWMKTISLNTVKRRNVTISLLNENHEPVVSWKVKNAFPVRFTGPILTANACTIAVEELELAHEGFTLEMA